MTNTQTKAVSMILLAVGSIGTLYSFSGILDVYEANAQIEKMQGVMGNMFKELGTDIGAEMEIGADMGVSYVSRGVTLVISVGMAFVGFKMLGVNSAKD